MNAGVFGGTLYPIHQFRAPIQQCFVRQVLSILVFGVFILGGTYSEAHPVDAPPPTLQAEPSPASVSPGSIEAIPKAPTISSPLLPVVDAVKTTQVAPGVVHQMITAHNGRGPLLINLLDVDFNNPQVSIKPILANKMNTIHGKATVQDIVARLQRDQVPVVAGLNGSFFKPDVGTTLGTYISGGEMLSGPIYNRVAVGFTPSRQILFDRVRIQGLAFTDAGLTLEFHNVNQPRTNTKDWVLYSRHWGTTSPATPKDGVQIQIDQGIITQIATTPLPIPAKGFVLLGPNAQMVQGLVVGNRVDFSILTDPNWSDVTEGLSGGPYLVKRGEVFVDAREQKLGTQTFMKPSPRTALGATLNRHVLLIAVDGRQDDVSVGMTLHELGAFLKQQGAFYAINLDGGSSTQMVVNGQLTSSPKRSGGERVGNAVVVLSSPNLPVDGISAPPPQATTSSLSLRNRKDALPY